MDLDELQPRKKLPDIVLGEDISALSAHELEARITRLEQEIATIQVGPSLFVGSTVAYGALYTC